NPIFDAMFVLQHAAPPGRGAGGLAVEPVPADTGATPFDLTLVMAESAGRLFGSLQFDADLFEEETADRLVARFVALARAFGSEPDARLGDLDLRSSGERRLVEATNATAIARPERLVH